MQELTAHRLLVRALRRNPESTLYVDDDDTPVSAGRHSDCLFRLVAGLRREVGLAADDVVAVIAANSHEYVLLWHVACLGGVVIAPLNARLHPTELGYMLRDSRAKAVFVDAANLEASSRAMVDAGLDLPLLSIGAQGTDSKSDVASIIDGAEAADLDEPDEGQRFAICYTGGTTGLPKGVVHAQRGAALNTWRYLYSLGPVTEASTGHVCMPLFHIAGALGAALGSPAAGLRTVLRSKFEPGAVLRDIERFSVTHMGLAPTMIAQILDDPSYRPDRLASLRQLGYGAAPMPLPVLTRLLEELPGLELVQTYGMTEAGGVVTRLDPSDHLLPSDHLGSVGRPLPGIGLTVRRPDGTEASANEAGEVCVQSGSLFAEYLNSPDETNRSFADGWYHTGDAGRLDDDGYLYLLDRMKDMIITGGENVFSIEVEQAIARHPDVVEVAVVGRPDPRWGEAIHAVVVRRPGSAIDQHAIISHTQALIARFKCPRSVEIRDEFLPRSAAGKILKRDLRDWTNDERVHSPT